MADDRDRGLLYGAFGAGRWRIHLVVFIVYWALVVPVMFLWNPKAAHWMSHHGLVWQAGAVGLLGAAIGEVASIRASLLKPGHRWPWQAKAGTKPLGLGKYSAVAVTDLLFGFLAGVVVYGEHIGLSPVTWKGTLTLFFAGMSGPEILHRLGGTIRK